MVVVVIVVIAVAVVVVMLVAVGVILVAVVTRSPGCSGWPPAESAASWRFESESSPRAGPMGEANAPATRTPANTVPLMIATRASIAGRTSIGMYVTCWGRLLRRLLAEDKNPHMQRRRPFAVIEVDMHILLVEDDDRLAAAVRRIFTAEGHVVDWVADGLEGLTQSEMEQYDVFVFDVMLPSLDGFEITRRIRRDGVRTPILLLTARDAVRDRVTGLDAGADDYLVKPFAPQELLARVRALGRRSSPQSMENHLLTVGDLELNVLTREAERGGKKIDLTAKEFVLLEELMRHAGQVMTRTRLLDTVWNYDVLTDSNVVDMYIHYLRTKIDKDFEVKLIRTVRGVGYAIRAD